MRCCWDRCGTAETAHFFADCHFAACLVLQLRACLQIFAEVTPEFSCLHGSKVTNHVVRKIEVDQEVAHGPAQRARLLASPRSLRNSLLWYATQRRKLFKDHITQFVKDDRLINCHGDLGSCETLRAGRFKSRKHVLTGLLEPKWLRSSKSNFFKSNICWH